MKAIAFTGHRPNKLDNAYDVNHPKRVAIREAMINRLRVAQTNYAGEEIVIISGGALGIDTDAALVAQMLGWRYVIASPCINQSKKWGPRDKKIYQDICRQASPTLAQELAINGEFRRDGVIYVTPVEYPGAWCMQTRNEWMVNHCDALFAIWDGTAGGTRNCVRYAKSQGKPIAYMDPRPF